ncbi:MAG: tRNA (adenosine(37)-N6)-dimethylallyltransferase MiaA [Saprospiraceae bacterium]|nr:tRNA (adenosine(37)-N6)-dimethylallyltransferase MiaA [Saprospiraceae bacterium]
MQKKLVIISGPTASGKSQLVLDLAQHYQTSIVSADSRQVYKKLNIGTAKPDLQAMNLVPHYLVDFIEIDAEYSVGQYLMDANQIIEELFQKNDIVFVAGGTGLYVNALIHGLDDFPMIDPIIKSNLTSIWKKEGVGNLAKELSILDPEYASSVDLKNPHRLIRALSVIKSSHQKYSSYLKNKSSHHNYPILHLLIEDSREVIYDRINRRVDLMIEMGLIDEVKDLKDYWECPSMKTVGYSELISYLKGECNLEKAIDKIKQHTRNYAKRQMTWYRKYHQGPIITRNIDEKLIQTINDFANPMID